MLELSCPTQGNKAEIKITLSLSCMVTSAPPIGYTYRKNWIIRRHKYILSLSPQNKKQIDSSVL